MARLLALAAALLIVVPAWSAEPEPIPKGLAVSLAKRLTESAGMLQNPPIKFEPDCSKATGLHEPEVGGLMVVPREGMSEDKTTGVEEPNGMPAGYLFLYKLTPKVEGKAAGLDQLPTVILKDDDGNDRTVVALRLAIKKEAGDNWKLLVFSKDKKPILASPFRLEENKSDLPLSVSVKEAKDREGKLVITAFGKYAADVVLTKVAE